MFRQEEEEYTRTSKGARTPRSVQEESSKNHCLQAEAEAVAVRDQPSPSPSLGFLQSAKDFEINDGSIASIGGDSFTARRDMHLTINISPASSSSSSLSSSLNASVTSLLIADENERARLREPSSERAGEVPSTSALAQSSATSSDRCCCGRRLGHEQGHVYSEETLILPALPVQRSCDIYRRHLATKGRGIPLYNPGLSKNLPVQHQRKGISIGDVGIVTESGSFIFLFSVCLPKGHPINPPVMPEGFEPFVRDAVQMLNVDVQRVFEENSYLASASSVRARRDGDSTGLIFESSEHDGAILTMPVGSKSEDLVNKARFQKYVKKNLKSWYHYAYHVRDFEVRNGDLRVVTGCDKTSTWGMATFFNSEAGCSGLNSSSRRYSDSGLGGGEPKFHLEFGLIENGAASGGGRLKRYGWECSGMAEVRAGPDARDVLELRGGDVEEENTVYENQCLFVRTMNATLPEKVWEELGFDDDEEEEEEESGSYENENGNGKSVVGSNRASSSSSSAGGGNSAATFSTSSASKTHLSASRSIANDYNAASVYSTLMSLVDHPSIVINDLLLKNCSDDTTMAITLDEDWMLVLRKDDFVMPSSDELLERIMETYNIREEDGVVFLDCKSVDEGQGGSSSFAILGVDEPSVEANEVNANEESPITINVVGPDSLANLDPNLSNCVDMLTSMYYQIQNVKVHRDKCRDLYDRSSRLLLELQGLTGKLPNIFDDADAVIMDIYRQVGEWSSWNKIKSILRQGEIKKDIERLCAKVDMASTRFSVLRNLEVVSKVKGARDRDKPVILDGEAEEAVARFTMNSIFDAMDDMNKARRQRLRKHALVIGIGGTMQETQCTGPSEFTSSSELRWDEHKIFLETKTARQTQLKPSRLTEIYRKQWMETNSTNQDTGPLHLLGKGSFGNVYRWNYWDTEKVSAPNRNQHQLFALRYHSALEYLHKKEVPREESRKADIRGENIVVKSEGVVRLSDFGISRTVEDGNGDLRRRTGSPTFLALLAPEVIHGVRGHEIAQTDVWAFGPMLALAFLDDRGSVLRDKSNAGRQHVHANFGSRRCIDDLRRMEGKSHNRNPDQPPKLCQPFPRGDLWDICDALTILEGGHYRSRTPSDYVSHIQRRSPIPSAAESRRSSIENLVMFSKQFNETTMDGCEMDGRASWVKTDLDFNPKIMGDYYDELSSDPTSLAQEICVSTQSLKTVGVGPEFSFAGPFPERHIETSRSPALAGNLDTTGEHNLGYMYFGMGARLAQARPSVDATAHLLMNCMIIQLHRYQNLVLYVNFSAPRPNVEDIQTSICGLPAGRAFHTSFFFPTYISLALPQCGGRSQVQEGQTRSLTRSQAPGLP